MNRRRFLASLGIGMPAAAIAAKARLVVDPKHPFQNNGATSGVCAVCGGIVPQHATFLTTDGKIRSLGYPGRLCIP
jgi:hypothetical protein